MWKHRLAFVVGVGVLSTGVSQWLAAQNGETGSKEKAAAAKEERVAPLPSYWGKLALNTEQRQKVYAIRDEYTDQIGELQKKIDALEKERDARMEKELTPGQKLRLQELREEARRRAIEMKAAEAALEASRAP